MVAAAISLDSRRYQLPAAAMIPFSLPGIGQAMREARAEHFSLQSASLVDFKEHTSFCREAVEGGFIQPGALEWLELYPNAYGLYRLTGEVITSIEAKVRIPTKRLFKGEKALLKRLETPYFDPILAASATVHCIETGLLEISEVAEFVADGPNCASALIQKVERALGNLLVVPECIASSMGYGVQGDNFILESHHFAIFELVLPVEDDFHEVRVLLFKTLDAMTHYLVPFHTPTTFLGEGSYYNHEVADAYTTARAMVSTSTHEDLVEYLLNTPSEQRLFDSWGFTGDEDFDEESADKFASMLLEMHQVTEQSGFYLGQDKAEEMQTLREQAQQICKKGGAYATILNSLIEALDVCLNKAEANYTFDHDMHGFGGTASDGIHFFESIVVHVSGDFQNLEESSYEGFDATVEGAGHPAIGFPLSGKGMVGQTIPILRDTSVCLDLLNKITTAIGEAKNAQQ